jgi:PAS domain S-box-containing protein
MVRESTFQTDEAAAQERLARMELQLATAQQLTHVGSWEWDLVHERVIWSDELYRVHGIEPATCRITYEYWLSRVHPDDRSRVLSGMEESLAYRDQMEGEYHIIREDGEVRLVHTIGQIVREDGRPVRVFGASRDVTEKRSAEAVLKESEVRFRQIFENVEDVFWMRDFTTQQIIFISPAYERIWGLSAESLLRNPTSWRSAVHPDDRPQVDRVLANDGERHDHTYRIVRPDGAIRWIRDRAFPIRNAEGRTVRLAGVATDITETREAQTKLQEKSEQLQRLSQRLLEVQESERRHLARELHDEVGQALTAAKISLQMAQQSTADAGLASDLCKSVDALDDLLRQVRRMSLDLRPPMLDDFGLLPALRWYLEQTMKRSGLEVRLIAPSKLERLEPGLETACYRVVQEAITNVVKHAEASQVEVELALGDELNVTVSDDGRGFDVTGAQDKARHGAAAGLGGMLERVSLLNGLLWIDSAPGQGTKVRACFPLQGGRA